MPEPGTIILLGGGLAGIGLRVVRQQFLRLKRLADVVIASFVLLLFSPCLLVTMLLVKLTSRGPVFFRQVRVGQHGKWFWIVKLRTMREDAEMATGPVWAARDDPRVTPVGRFLRSTHLDEVPQLINVLKGDMSIVGPRPERPIFVSEFARKFRDYGTRLHVRPGITGLAQIRCRADESTDDVRRKLGLDLVYVRRMCWLVDFRIMLATVRFLLGRGHQRRRPVAAA